VLRSKARRYPWHALDTCRLLEVARHAYPPHSAVKIQEFLDNIEESERIYHLGGVEIELRTIRELVH